MLRSSRCGTAPARGCGSTRSGGICPPGSKRTGRGPWHWLTPARALSCPRTLPAPHSGTPTLRTVMGTVARVDKKSPRPVTRTVNSGRMYARSVLIRGTGSHVTPKRARAGCERHDGFTAATTPPAPALSRRPGALPPTISQIPSSPGQRRIPVACPNTAATPRLSATHRLSRTRDPTGGPGGRLKPVCCGQRDPRK